MVEGLIEARAIVERHTQPETIDNSTMRLHPNDATLRQPVEGHLLEAYRNVCKLGAWMAGNTDAYREWDVTQAFLLGSIRSVGGVAGVE